MKVDAKATKAVIIAALTAGTTAPEPEEADKVVEEAVEVVKEVVKTPEKPKAQTAAPKPRHGWVALQQEDDDAQMVVTPVKTTRGRRVGTAAKETEVPGAVEKPKRCRAKQNAKVEEVAAEEELVTPSEAASASPEKAVPPPRWWRRW